MDWYEFTTKLQLLNEKTALGKIVSIRAENDNEVLKNFTNEQKRIRNEYRNRKAKNINMNDYNAAMAGFKEMFKSMSKKK
jgi:Tfp pilus assembly protein PilO